MPAWAIVLIVLIATYLAAAALTAIIKAGERRDEQKEREN